MILALTVLIMFGLPEPYVTSQLSLAVLMPSLLALMLLNEWWVLGAGIAVAAALIVRSGGTGPFSGDPVTLVIYGIAIAVMVVIRLLTTTALTAARRNEHRAAAALASVQQKAAELAEANELMNVQLDQQQQLLNLVTTLETPAVQVADGVLLVPLIGHVDSRRAQDLTQKLLEQVHVQNARHVILDIAGVSLMDTGVTQSVLTTIRAIRLLGCNVRMSGISAEVAMTLTHLGVDLSELHTVRSPQEALSSIAEISRRDSVNGSRN